MLDHESKKKKTALDFIKERIDDKKAELKTEKEIEDFIKIEKEKLAVFEEPVAHEETSPGITVKKLEPKYDYSDVFAFREKENKK